MCDLDSNDYDLSVSEDEVRRLFSSVNPSKAAGPDRLSPKNLKNSLMELSYIFTYMFNLSFKLRIVPRLGRISWSGLTQDIKMGSCVFQCDSPYQWIAQRQVGPGPCLYTVTAWGVISCVYGMAFLCDSTLVKVPLLRAGEVAM